MNHILVFAEQRDGELKKVAFENISLAKKLATDSGARFTTVLIGYNLSGMETQLTETMG